MTESLIPRFAKVRLVVTDVDGVLTDGGVYLDNADNEWKRFNIKDGLGIKMLLQHGISVAIITGRTSRIVSRRAKELGITYVYQGCTDKRAAFLELLEKHDVTPEETAHVGDDLPDLPLMRMAGIGVAVQDAHPFVKAHADWITKTPGGMGAFREVADTVLRAQNALDSFQQKFLR